ncbi:hypothetical protein COCOBI_12-4090 [Coccomyxa sp. Obi]|nr:hypothetical protein COCOBI_12-4090 [Coccomyxa sp. Obi]
MLKRAIAAHIVTLNANVKCIRYGKIPYYHCQMYSAIKGNKENIKVATEAIRSVELQLINKIYNVKGILITGTDARKLYCSSSKSRINGCLGVLKEEHTLLRSINPMPTVVCMCHPVKFGEAQFMDDTRAALTEMRRRLHPSDSSTEGERTIGLACKLFKEKPS